MAFDALKMSCESVSQFPDFLLQIADTAHGACMTYWTILVLHRHLEQETQNSWTNLQQQMSMLISVSG